VKTTGKWTSGVAWAVSMTLSGCLFASAPGGGGGDAGVDPVEDPCEEVTCNDAGRCIDLGEGAYECVCELGFGGEECERCDIGYEPEGDECVLESLCEMFQCPGTQTCEEIDGDPVCVCPDGLVPGERGECVSVCDDPELDPCDDSEVCLADGDEVECLPAVDTCAGLRAMGLATADGVYTLYYDRDPEQPWEVYCHDMEGAPAEYLPLPATGGFRNLFEEHSHNRQTSYERVRIDPTNLRVRAQDGRFATTTELMGPGGGPDTNYTGNVYFGTTGSCGGGREGGDPPGRGTIDLTGTPFFVETQFAFGGQCASGPEPRYLERGQVVELEATGSCGFVAPRPNAEAEGNVCPNDPSLDRLPMGPPLDTWTVRLGYSADLLVPE
jgi:hypothetical protein